MDGEAFYIKGAGASDISRLETLKNHGANAFRTWSTHNGTEILDKAHELGLKVMMGALDWFGASRIRL